MLYGRTRIAGDVHDESPGATGSSSLVQEKPWRCPRLRTRRRYCGAAAGLGANAAGDWAGDGTGRIRVAAAELRAAGQEGIAGGGQHLSDRKERRPGLGG